MAHGYVRGRERLPRGVFKAGCRGVRKEKPRRCGAGFFLFGGGAASGFFKGRNARFAVVRHRRGSGYGGVYAAERGIYENAESGARRGNGQSRVRRAVVRERLRALHGKRRFFGRFGGKHADFFGRKKSCGSRRGDRLSGRKTFRRRYGKRGGVRGVFKRRKKVSSGHGQGYLSVCGEKQAGARGVFARV